MFLKPKFSAAGVFEKLKATLVGDGRCQGDYLGDGSAPTAILESIFAVLKISCVEKRKVRMWDVGTTFLNAPIDDEDEIHMFLERDIVDMVVTWFPELSPYQTEDGRMVVKLTKALYGLVQSAMLWYRTIAGFLTKNGFVVNDYDKCVLNKTLNGTQITICLYVDDMLCTCKDESLIEDMKRMLIEEYRDIQEKNGTEISYLGMMLRLKEGRIELSMEHYIRELIKSYGRELKAFRTPAANDLYEDRSGGEMIENQKLWWPSCFF